MLIHLVYQSLLPVKTFSCLWLLLGAVCGGPCKSLTVVLGNGPHGFPLTANQKKGHGAGSMAVKTTWQAVSASVRSLCTCCSLWERRLSSFLWSASSCPSAHSVDAHIFTEFQGHFMPGHLSLSKSSIQWGLGGLLR